MIHKAWNTVQESQMGVFNSILFNQNNEQDIQFVHTLAAVKLQKLQCIAYTVSTRN